MVQVDGVSFKLIPDTHMQCHIGAHSTGAHKHALEVSLISPGVSWEAVTHNIHHEPNHRKD